MKVITILDSFISNSVIEDNTINMIDKLKSINSDILLVSANKVSEKVQSKVDYMLYDSRNQLFEKTDYQYFHPWNFWIGCGSFTSYNFYYAKQRHGLAVMVNLFNALSYAKSLGYTHFQKILYDMDINQECMNWLENVPQVCSITNKKGLVYYNLNQGDNPDMNGSYMFCEIDYFLSKIPKIGSEEDYRRNIVSSFGYLKFLIFEKFLYHFFTKNGDSELLIRNSDDYKNDFPGIVEGGQISSLNFNNEYEGAPTRITKIDGSEDLIVFTHNFTNEVKNRKIISIKGDQRLVFYQDLSPFGGWSYNQIDKDTDRIEVYESDRFLYTEENNSEVKNYIKYH
jgi:hypothetical protein